MILQNVVSMHCRQKNHEEQSHCWRGNLNENHKASLFYMYVLDIDKWIMTERQPD